MAFPMSLYKAAKNHFGLEPNATSRNKSLVLDLKRAVNKLAGYQQKVAQVII